MKNSNYTYRKTLLIVATTGLLLNNIVPIMAFATEVDDLSDIQENNERPSHLEFTVLEGSKLTYEVSFHEDISFEQQTDSIMLQTQLDQEDNILGYYPRSALVKVNYSNGEIIESQTNGDNTFIIKTDKINNEDEIFIEFFDLTVPEDQRENTQPTNKLCLKINKNNQADEINSSQPEVTEEIVNSDNVEDKSEDIPTDTDLEVIKDTELLDQGTEENQKQENESLTEKTLEDVLLVEPDIQAKVFTSSSVIQQNATKYYYVYSGDTLTSIANRYNVSVNDLKSWNNLVVNTINVGQLISVNGKNNYSDYNKETRGFSSNSEFVNYIAGVASRLSKANGIYASVMAAQASLETSYGKSALSRLGNNLFGVKSFNSNEPQIIINTTEYINNKPQTVKASFKFYPSYSESIMDNINKLKNGVSWDSNFYKGALVENTDWYKDSTLFLTQRYATDTKYYKKLNNLINVYNLTKYDTIGNTKVQSEYRAMFTGSNNPIGNLPFNQVPSTNGNYKNIQEISQSSDHFGREMKVLQKTRDSKYLNIEYRNSDNVIVEGWVSPEAVTKIDFTTNKVNYSSIIDNSGYSIDSLPWGYKGSQKNDVTSNYLNSQIQVVSETANGAYVYVVKDGKGIGWVDSRALTSYKVKTVDYTTYITAGNFQVGNSPWGVKDYQKITLTKDYIGAQVTAIAETLDGSYVLVEHDNVEIGWVDSRSLGLTKGSYEGVIISGNYDVSNLAWGSKGYKRLALSKDYQGVMLQFKGETKDGAYTLAYKNGTVIGWIDTRAIQQVKTQNTNRTTYVINRKFSIDTLPWGVPGYKSIGSTSDWTGKEVFIKAYAKNTSYALIYDRDREIGWVDIRALTDTAIELVNYDAYIGSGKYQVNSLPWGTPGYTIIGKTSEIINQKVTVTQKTKDNAYVFITINGKEIGWIDIRALGYHTPQYDVYVSNGKYSLDSLPWGTPGSKKIGNAHELIGKTLTVNATTNNGGYCLLYDGNQEIGWIDTRGITRLAVKQVAMETFIKSGNYEINTLPWGSFGFAKTGMSSTYLNQRVNISKVTLNGSYGFASITGQEIGWIDIRAFDL